MTGSVLGPFVALGRTTTRRFSALGGPARFAFEAVAALPSLPGAGRRVAVRVLLNQLRFTALQAVPLVVLLSALLSFVVIRSSIQTFNGATDFVGTVMVVVVVQLMGPLLTALAVIGRSGTAITAELATNTVMGEIRALEGIGIDPYHYLVLPRMIGVTISMTILIVLFDVVALVSGFLATSVSQASGERYITNVFSALDTGDVVFTVVKGVLFGLMIGILPSYHGLRVTRGPTEIPQAVTRGTVAAIISVFIITALVIVIHGA